MRKTKDITKYNLAWQLVRQSAKLQKKAQDKVNLCLSFLEETPNKANHERVRNWVEGLERGYRRVDQSVCEYLNEVVLPLVDSVKLEDVPDAHIDISTVSLRALDALYNDLYIRGFKWLNKGYIHQEHEQFMDMLAEELDKRSELSYKHEEYLRARRVAATIENTHKFLY